MSGPLDARQRAMLVEMGIRVWQPRPAAASPAPAARPAAPLPASAPPPGSAPAARARPPVQTPAAPPGPAAAPAPLAPRPDASAMDWEALQAAVAACRACELCNTRTQTVFGVGHAQADWMVIGEAPGANEDRLGQPFVGQAGQLLDNMLAAVGRSREAQDRAGGVYIANVIKCRPPSNRNPQPEEIAQCLPWLERQVALVQPRIILAMGRFAVQSLLGTTDPIGRLRGRVHDYQGVPVVVTYHPAYLLRAPADKAKAWADLCLALETAGGP